MRNKNVLHLVVFIDAFGWEIAKRHSFLDDILIHKAPLNTTFGYSSTCIPTILTGKLPREHGHFSFFYYNPQASPFAAMRYLKLFPRNITRRGRIRRYMSRIIKRYYGFTGYFQIYNMPFEHLHLFDYSEKRDLYQPGGINSGANTFLDVLRQANVPFSVSDWRDAETGNLQRVKQDISVGRVPFAYLYLAELDGILHANGTGAPVVSEKIRWYDRELRKVIACAEKSYDELRLVVFSDHGQADVVMDYDLISRVETLNLRFGVDYVAVYDSTMARFWFLKDGVSQQVRRLLDTGEHGRVLSDGELGELGCDFPNNKYGELIFLVDPGVLICPSFLGETHLAAMHGYHPNDKDSVAMIGSNHVLHPQPDGLADMYELIRAEVMGAE